MTPAGVARAGAGQGVTGPSEALSPCWGVQGAEGLIIHATKDLLTEAFRHILARLQTHQRTTRTRGCRTERYCTLTGSAARKFAMISGIVLRDTAASEAAAKQ